MLEKKSCKENSKMNWGLLADMPNQQTGNTNDDNNTRRFFPNYSEIAGFRAHRFHINPRFRV